MQVLISAFLGGLIALVIGLLIHFLIKDPVKKKKLAPLAVIPVIFAMPFFNNERVPQKIMGLFNPSYRVQEHLIQRMKPLLEDPRVKAELEKGAQHAQAYAFILTQQGIKHLDDNDLDRWNEFRIQIAESHKPFCSSLMSGQMSEEMIFEAFSSIPSEKMDEFIDLMMKGAKRKLDNEGSPKSHVTFFQEGLKNIINALPEGEKEKFAKILYNPKNASGEDACWATLKLLKGAREVPQETRAKMFKLMVGV